MRLKRVREAKGLSQTTVTTLTKLAKALGVPVAAPLE